MLDPVFPLLRVHAEMTFPESLSLEVLHAGPATPSNAPPLLFVHGAFCGAWIWQEHFLDWFAARGYNAYAVSLRGHGNSGSLNDLQRAGMNDFVEDVSHVLTGLPRPPVLIGHSMGGMVVQRLIERNPLHTAAGAVLMSSVSPGGLWGTTLHMALNTPNILWTLAGMQTFGTQMASAEALHRALFPASVPLETTQKYLTRFQTESMRAQSDLTFSPPPVATHGKSTPMLVIGASEDTFVPPWMARSTARYYDAPCHILNGMGHAMMLEPDWERAATILLDWLADTFPS
ncbi:alpha/beta hydrolase [Novispirillum itersonii]|uniref:alpha/beta hydrolase n=1 Tax=Novispirillum itersonii TaxID=189 RepID=UPI00037BC056|nr:alpha/beta hydrolase [Novispirillum itersonii]